MEVHLRPLFENATYRCFPAQTPCCGPLFLLQPKGPEQAESLRYRAFVHLQMNDPRLVPWEETPTGFLVHGRALYPLRDIRLQADDPIGGPLGREFGQLLTSLLSRGIVPVDLESVLLARTASNQLRVIDLGACRPVDPLTIWDSMRRFHRGIAPIFDWLFSLSEPNRALRGPILGPERSRQADLRRVQYALNERLEYVRPLSWGRGCSTDLCRKDGRELLVREALTEEGGAYLQRMARLSEIVGEGVFSVWRPMDHLLVTSHVAGEALMTAMIDRPDDCRASVAGQFVQAVLHLLLRDVVPIRIGLRDIVVTEQGHLRILEIGQWYVLGEEAPARWVEEFVSCVQAVLGCTRSSSPKVNEIWEEALRGLEVQPFSRASLDVLCAFLWKVTGVIDRASSHHRVTSAF